MTTPQERLLALTELLEQRILVLDGAMGTMLQQRQLTAEDFGGPALEGCNENLVRTRPDVVLTFIARTCKRARTWWRPIRSTARPWCWRTTACRTMSHELNLDGGAPGTASGGRIFDGAQTALCGGFDGPHDEGHYRYRRCDFPAPAARAYYDQAKAAGRWRRGHSAGGNRQDTRNVKAALLAIGRLREELGWRIPVMVSGTIETMGTMLAGQTADALYASHRACRSAFHRPELRRPVRSS